MKKSSIVISLTAFFSAARVDIVGKLFGSEVVMLLFFPYRKINGILGSYPLLTKLAFAYLLFFVSLVFSDLFINDTVFQNYLRGWANLVFAFFSVFFLTSQFGKSKKNILLYIFFFGVSFFLFRKEMDELFYVDRTDNFKIYYMVGVNCLVLLLAYFSTRYSKKAPIIIFLLYAIFCLIVDARSNGVIYFLSSLILIVKLFKIKLTKPRLTLVGLLLIGFSYLAYITYVNKVLDGELKGDNTQQLRTVKNPYNPIGLLTIGRSEVFVALEAIQEKPIFGYGSWAEDKSGKYNKLQASFAESDQIEDTNLIPAHSVIFTAWLWAGILGFISVGFIYVMIIRKGIFILLNSSSPILIILSPLFFEMIWDLLFSPLGHLRLTAPLPFALIIVEYYRTKTNVAKQNKAQ